MPTTLSRQDIVTQSEEAFNDAIQDLRQTGNFPQFTLTRLNSNLDTALTEVAAEIVKHKAGMTSGIRLKIEKAERIGKALEKKPEDGDRPYEAGTVQPFIDAFIEAVGQRLEVSKDVARGRGGVAA